MELFGFENDPPKVGHAFLLVAKFSCCDSSHQQQNLDQRITVNPPSSYKKMSGQDVWTHPPMVLLAMTQEIKLSGIFRDS